MAALVLQQLSQAVVSEPSNPYHLEYLLSDFLQKFTSPDWD